VPRNKEEHGKNSAREGTNEHCILNARPVLSELLAAVIRESTIEFCLSSAISTTTVSMAAVAAIFPSVASDPVNPATTTHSGNLATASKKFIKTSVRLGPQNCKALPSFGTIMPITGGSAMEFETKKQRSNYFRSVNTIINDGPAARPEWAKVPSTFTEEDFRLKSAIHNDAMVIEVNIAGWVIGKVLVDNGSSTHQSTHCRGSEKSPSSWWEKYHSRFLSEILRMPERRASLSM
jgi:hypothetical protein